MALVLKDRVKETTSTAGTGTITLSGAAQGFQGFSAVGEGNTTYYCIASALQWEVGIGTYSSGLLTRDTILGSSENGAKVGFSAGIKDVFCVYPATKAITTDTLPVNGAVNVLSPNATTNVSSLTAATTSTNGDLALTPKGNGALLGQTPTDTSAGGNKRGLYATDWSRFRLSAASVASGDYSTVAGGADNRASGLYSAVGGGNGNISAGNSSFVGSGIENQANSLGSGVSAGRSNIASGNYAAVGGGLSNTASGTEAFVGGGELNTASATNGVTGGGLSNTNSGQYGTLSGGRSNSLTSNYGSIAGGQANTSSAVYGAVGGGYTNTVSGQYATVAGGYTNSATADYAVVGGGGSNQATGSTSVAAGGLGNIASGLFASSGGGNSNTASGQGAVIPGGSNNVSSGQYSGVLSGSTNTASGDNSFVAGGDTNLASGRFSGVIGGQYGTTRGIVGYLVTPASEVPIQAKAGVQQSGCLIVGCETTNATATKLRSDTNAAGAANQLILQNNSAVMFFIDLVGWDQTDYITVNVINGMIVRGANAASTVLKSPGYQNYEKSTGASTWLMALSADTTNGGLIITVTGQASKTIRWVAKIFTTEVAF